MLKKGKDQPVTKEMACELNGLWNRNQALCFSPRFIFLMESHRHFSHLMAIHPLWINRCGKRLQGTNVKIK